MKKTVVENVIKEGEVVGIRVQTEDKGTFVVPVVDVRRGPKNREAAKKMLKQENIQRGSKYIKPSHSIMGYSYNASMKGTDF